VLEKREAALELLEQGLCVVPIHPKAKHPRVSWKQYQTKLPTEAEVDAWFTDTDDNVCIITGEHSGIIVVDCDNEDAIVEAEKLGLTRTPISVTSKKGKHFYFAYPKGRGVIGSRVGKADGSGIDWPAVAGLDLRADRGVIVCPPTPNYTWHKGCDFDELPEYPYGHSLGLGGNNVVSIEEFQFKGVDLSQLKVELNIWESTKLLVDKIGKLQTGDGNARDHRVYTALGMAAGQGLHGDALYANIYDFMDRFFVERLDDTKIDQMIQRVEREEERKNPDYKKVLVDKPKPTISPITTADIERLEAQIGTREYCIDPWLPLDGTVIQVHGYSGHGKSMFIRNALYHVAAGAKEFGPWEIGAQARVLYLDLENSRSNITNFLDRSKRSVGDAGDNFMVYAPFDNEEQMNLKSDNGMLLLTEWIKTTDPDIVCVDTVRSAWVGLEENSASEWGRINQMALDLRNAGITVILVHHSNKPSESKKFGSFAGSSNQLTVLETQIKITQVFRDPDTAEMRGGIDDNELPHSIWNAYEAGLKGGERCDVIIEARYGKVRDWSDAHQTHHYVGFASNPTTITSRVFGKMGVKKLARYLAQPHEGHDGQMRSAKDDLEISREIDRPLEVVREWTRDLRKTNVATKVTNLQA
tara:strand:+ start:16399 stop:18321 length:1923 start_codon:yes stop_codon:yes gene_type:complete